MHVFLCPFLLEIFVSSYFWLFAFYFYCILNVNFYCKFSSIHLTVKNVNANANANTMPTPRPRPRPFRHFSTFLFRSIENCPSRPVQYYRIISNIFEKLAFLLILRTEISFDRITFFRNSIFSFEFRSFEFFRTCSALIMKWAIITITVRI